MLTFACRIFFSIL